MALRAVNRPKLPGPFRPVGPSLPGPEGRSCTHLVPGPAPGCPAGGAPIPLATTARHLQPDLREEGWAGERGGGPRTGDLGL
jgi:hypothetical protein